MAWRVLLAACLVVTLTPIGSYADETAAQPAQTLTATAATADSTAAAAATDQTSASTTATDNASATGTKADSTAAATAATDATAAAPTAADSTKETTESTTEKVAATEAAAVSAQDEELSAQGTVDASITLTSKATGEAISGVTFEFFKKDLSTGALTSLGTDVTDANGVASVSVNETGRYVAKYVSGLSSKYDVNAVSGLEYEITVSSNNQPGVQLTEDWGLGLSGLAFRDVVGLDGNVVAVGRVNDATYTIPGSSTVDGKDIVLNQADGMGVVLKIDPSTGKIEWVKQFASDNASYSLTDLGDKVAVVNYSLSGSGNPTVVYLFDADGNQTGSFEVDSDDTCFDIHSTSDGGVVLVNKSNQIMKYTADGTKVWGPISIVTESSFAKSVIQDSDDTYVVSGGGNSNTAFVGKYTIANGVSTTDWLFTIKGANTCRFNDVIKTDEGDYVASGDMTFPDGTTSYTIPASQTASAQPITISTNPNGKKAALLVKFNSEGKVIWAQSLFSENSTATEAGEFNSVSLATDGAGGYVVSGKLSGTVTVQPGDNIFDQVVTIVTNSTSTTDAVIVRYTADGKYIDSYLYGTDTDQTGTDDQYYGSAAVGDKVYALGNDANKNIVQLSSALTATPRPVQVPSAAKYKVTTAVNDADGGTISGQGWTYWEEVEAGGTTTKDITATPNEGWYLASVTVNGTVVATPNTTSSYTLDPLTVNEDTEVVANFVKGLVPTAKYQVTFESNGGSAVASQTVEENATATQPADPTRDGYDFRGWYSDAALTTAYDFSTPVTADITLYAKWTQAPQAQDQYTVTFESNGGSAVASQTVTSGATATEPADPTYANHGFDGWYTDAALTTAYDFSTPVTADTTLYAKWHEVTASVVKGVSSDTVAPGENASYAITVTNNENVPISGVYVKDYLPEYTLYVSCDNGGIYRGVDANADGREYVTWFIDTLQPGQSVTLDLTVLVDECVPIGATISNIAYYDITGSVDRPSSEYDPSNATNAATMKAVNSTTTKAAASTTSTTAKTGDATPVAVLVLLMVAAAGCVLYARRKMSGRE